MNKKIILGIVVALVAIAGSIYAYNVKSTSKECCKMASNATAFNADHCECSMCEGDVAKCDELCQKQACCTKESSSKTNVSHTETAASCNNTSCDEKCTCGDTCKGTDCDCPCTACK
jgi:hypothetical protein